MERIRERLLLLVYSYKSHQQWIAQSVPEMKKTLNGEALFKLFLFRFCIALL